MTRRTDLLIVGGGLAVTGAALLAYLAATALTPPRVLGVALLIAAGLLIGAMGVQAHGGPARAPRRDPQLYGALLILGGVEVVLWNIGTTDRAGDLGAATGLLLVGAILVVRGRSRLSAG